jgi:hypothetical protein
MRICSEKITICPGGVNVTTSTAYFKKDEEREPEI